MVAHEAVGVALDRVAGQQVGEHCQELQAILSIAEDVSMAGASVHHVMPGAWVLDSNRMGHNVPRGSATEEVLPEPTGPH